MKNWFFAVIVCSDTHFGHLRNEPANQPGRRFHRFDIANNFAIRHHDPKQKTNYDQTIWYAWICFAWLTNKLSFGLRRSQTGNVQRYAVGLFVGVVILAAVLIGGLR